MATIEERAYAIYPNLDFCNNETKRAFAEARQKLISFATEQDRIARKEERERCIKAVQDAWCKGCRAYCTRHGHTGSCIEYEEDCKEFNLIRKAIEGGAG